VDVPAFAGGIFSFWKPLKAFASPETGSRAHFTQQPGLPSLRTNKEEGQANFVNPGIFHS